ncbi:MAG TPA: hypothetical protein VK537_08100 [Galbitalea sp.]|nr:hypothetical protein [Galbitalea sp.]
MISKSRLIRAIPIVALVALVALLAGCAAPTPTHTSAISTPKPTPTAAHAAAPSIRVPVRCADLFSDVTAASMIDSTVQFHINETTLPKDIRFAAERQYGSLDCAWAGPDRPDGGYAEYFGVTIVPDAAAAFNGNIADVQEQDPPTLKNVAGDQSELECFINGGLQCSSNMLVGDYWVAVQLNAGGSNATVSVGTSRMRSALTTIASRLSTATATAGAVWNPPGASLPTFCADDAHATSAVAVDAAVDGTGFFFEDSEAAPETASGYPRDVGDYAECDWTTLGAGTFNDVFVAMLKGGAWVMPPLLGDLGVDSLERGPFRTVDISGAGTAAVSCTGDSGSCDALVADGSVLIHVSLDYASNDIFDAALIKLVTAVAAT